MPTRTIAVALQAGGVGKTTLSHNLGFLLADRGRKVLLVDTDGQCNLTDAVKILDPNRPDAEDVAPDPQRTIYQVLVEMSPLPIRDAIVRVRGREQLYLLPGSSEMARFDAAVAARDHREYLLRDQLAAVDGEYDFILIDCPPGLGLVLTNALLAANEVLIPVQTRQRRANALPIFARVLARSLKYNPTLRVTGIVPTQYDRRNSHDKQAFGYIERFAAKHNLRLFDPITTTTRIAELDSLRVPLCDYDRNTEAATALEALAEGLDQALGRAVEHHAETA